MKKFLLGLLILAALGASGQVANQNVDILGQHNLGLTTNPVSGPNSSACLYCHAPHSGASRGPLWSQTFSTQSYSLYTSDTLQNTPEQPELGKDSNLCLSCHDGTVAPGQVNPGGALQMNGTMTNVFGTKMESSHPFSLPINHDATHLVASLYQSKTTADTSNSVKLVNGVLECTSCHNAHNQYIDVNAPYFLTKDNKNGALCLSCHETNPRTIGTATNPLQQWPLSIHATSPAQISAGSGVGTYSTVAETACLSCHASHNAGGASGLLRNPTPSMVGVDTTSQSCFRCHDGSRSMVQPLANVLAEFRKSGHPFATATSTHTMNEPALLNQNRHATCADCHNAHLARATTTFTSAPNIRPSQGGAVGVGTDGNAIVGGATREFETCLRCHGTSSGKQTLTTFGYYPLRMASAGDALNMIPQFDVTAGSAHPVMRDATLASQPSLRASMLGFNGQTPTRTMGTRIFCSDCHNSDDNRESGGTGPNGPHGSVNSHILERRYEMSQVAPGTGGNTGPGSPVINLFPLNSPYPELNPGSGGPYELCAKCHDLQNIMNDVTFTEHRRHIRRGFSCSVCHTGHGVPAGSANLTGRRLVNFDSNVVAPRNGVISYTNGTCTLVCHGHQHH